MNTQQTAEPMLHAGSGWFAGLSDELAGLGNFMVKDLLEWFRTRRALWTALAAQGLLLAGVLGMRIYASIQPGAEGIDLSPSFNMENAGWETVLPLIAAFTTMSFLAGERENRTLAWSLSMPLGRTSVLISKLVTSVAAVLVLAAALPLATTLVAVRVAYGAFPDGASVVGPLLTGVAIGVFLIVLNLASSTFFRGRTAIVGIALCSALVVPGLVETVWKAASPWWPMSIEFWIKGLANHNPVNWITPLAYLAAVVGLLIAAQVRFSGDEF
jgi:ABC-type multidrug transport system permease subunit